MGMQPKVCANCGVVVRGATVRLKLTKCPYCGVPWKEAVGSLEKDKEK